MSYMNSLPPMTEPLERAQQIAFELEALQDLTMMAREAYLDEEGPPYPEGQFMSSDESRQLRMRFYKTNFNKALWQRKKSLKHQLHAIITEMEDNDGQAGT